MTKRKGMKHIMNFDENDSGVIKLDRVCRMLRALDNVSYSTTLHKDENGTVLWAWSTDRRGITKAFHQEIKARAIGIVFAIDHSGEMIGSPQSTYTETNVENYGGKDAFISLPSEDRPAL